MADSVPQNVQRGIIFFFMANGILITLCLIYKLVHNKLDHGAEGRSEEKYADNQGPKASNENL